MANEELYSALKAADAAGDIAGARKLAQYIQALPADGGVKAATSAPSKTLPSAGLMDKVNAYSGSPMDAIGGLVRGAGSIGATIAYPKDKITDMVQGDRGKNLSSLITGRELPSRNDERRQAMDDALQGLGADPNSKTYKGMKMLGEVAGTAGIGGGVTAPVLNAIGAPLKVVNAARSAGMSVSSPGFVGAAAPAPVANAFARAAGGAVTGGASAGLVNPSDVPTGAAIGALAPGVIQGAGYAGGKIGGAVWDALTPDIQKRAVQLAQLTGKSLDEVISGLKQQGPSLIPGSGKTVPTILQDPNISQVARTLLNQGEYGLRNREAQNNLARIAAIDRVAPTAGTVNEARENAGNAIGDFARASEKAASGRVSQLFNAIPKADAQVKLPFGDMQAAIDKYLGKGSFGEGEGVVNTAMNKARQIGTESVPVNAAPVPLQLGGATYQIGAAPGAMQTVPKLVPFDELQHLRSSIGEAANKAKISGDLQASAALKQMKAAIDNQMGAAVGGDASAGNFTAQAADAYGQALNAHAAKKLQFNTGQQAQIFRQGANGQPMLEGAQVAPLFWNGGNNQVRAIEDFNRLTGSDKTLTGLLKSNATTELLDQAKGAKGPLTPDGSLTANGVDKWMRNHAGALENLFSQPEKSTLKAVQNEIGAVGAAENLGRATGSNTAQNLFSAGALDSPALKAAANGIKGVRLITGPALEWVKNSSAANRNKLLSALLEDPELMAKTLQASKVRDEAGAKLAELLNSPQAKQLLYRAAPVAISGR